MKLPTARGRSQHTLSLRRCVVRARARAERKYIRPTSPNSPPPSIRGVSSVSALRIAAALDPMQHSAGTVVREPADMVERMARLGVSCEALSGMLRENGEDDLAERALSFSDDEL